MLPGAFRYHPSFRLADDGTCLASSSSSAAADDGVFYSNNNAQLHQHNQQAVFSFDPSHLQNNHLHLAPIPIVNYQPHLQTSCLSSVGGGKVISQEDKQVLTSTPSSATHQVRKERSRKAARNRRGRENKEFEALANLLPFEQGISSQLDKASIVRLVISYLKLRDRTPHLLKVPLIPTPTTPPVKHEPLSNEFLYEKCHGSRIQEALEGFMLVFEVARPGRILYVSQTVANFTGLALVDLIGRSIYDYLHPDDGDEVGQRLAAANLATLSSPASTSTCSTSSSPSLCPSNSNNSSSIAADDVPFTFQARFKCTANKRGTFFKVPGYRLFSLVGRLRYGSPTGCYLNSSSPSSALTLGGDDSTAPSSSLCYQFVGAAIALPSVSISEYSLSGDQIVFKLDNDLKVVDYDASQNEAEWLSVSLTRSKSTLYDICHPEDVDRLRQEHRQFLLKNQALIPGLRIICSEKLSICGTLWIAGVQLLPPANKQQQTTANSNVASNSSRAGGLLLPVPSASSPAGLDITIMAIFTPISHENHLTVAVASSDPVKSQRISNWMQSSAVDGEGTSPPSVSLSSPHARNEQPQTLICYEPAAKKSRQNEQAPFVVTPMAATHHQHQGFLDHQFFASPAEFLQVPTYTSVSSSPSLSTSAYLSPAANIASSNSCMFQVPADNLFQQTAITASSVPTANFLSTSLHTPPTTTTSSLAAEYHQLGPPPSVLNTFTSVHFC